MTLGHPPGAPISGVLVRALVHVARSEGVFARGERAHELDPSLKHTAIDHLEEGSVRALLAVLDTNEEDRALGLLAGERITEPNLHVFGTLITASRTLRDAHDHIAAMVEHAGTQSVGQLSARGAEIRYALSGSPLDAMWEDLVMSLCLHTARRFIESALSPAGRAQGYVLRVELARPRPDNADAYAPCFRGAVSFGAAQSALVFLAPRIRALAARHRRRARRGAARAGAAPHRARSEPAGGVERARAPSAAGARATGERAAHALTDTPASVAEVAAMLGYADEASFRRAFKRWTGLAPQDYRSRTRQG